MAYVKKGFQGGSNKTGYKKPWKKNNENDNRLYLASLLYEGKGKVLSRAVVDVEFFKEAVKGAISETEVAGKISLIVLGPRDDDNENVIGRLFLVGISDKDSEPAPAVVEKKPFGAKRVAAPAKTPRSATSKRAEASESPTDEDQDGATTVEESVADDWD